MKDLPADYLQRSRQALQLESDRFNDLNTWLLGDADRYAGKLVATNIHRLAASGVNFVRTRTAAKTREMNLIFRSWS